MITRIFQLHITGYAENLQFCLDGISDEKVDLLKQEYYKYMTLFLLDPSSLGIDENLSYLCGVAGKFAFVFFMI